MNNKNKIIMVYYKNIIKVNNYNKVYIQKQMIYKIKMLEFMLIFKLRMNK